jgi:hypothetical protein
MRFGDTRSRRSSELTAAVPANDGKDFARNIARALRGRQEYKRQCNLLGLRGPAHRGLRSELGDLAALFVRSIECGPHRARCYRINANSARQHLAGEGPREGMNATFGGRVVDQILIALESRSTDLGQVAVSSPRTDLSAVSGYLRRWKLGQQLGEGFGIDRLDYVAVEPGETFTPERGVKSLRSDTGRVVGSEHAGRNIK